MSGGSRLGMLPKGERNRHAHRILTANTHLVVRDLMTLITAEIPSFTETSLRMMIFHYGIKVKKDTTAKPHSGPHNMADTTVARTMPEPTHMPVQSYHGRSRYLPAYYEL